MMYSPWDRAQPDEWLPRSLRLCWGSSGGGGFSSDSGGGGWGGDGGFASTGGGDWGSAGSFDASGFNAGGDLGAWAGTAYDASTAGTGAGAGGDWGSFAATNYGGMNAPNPTFADVAGPNPGVTTGGGDWGSAGTFSAAGTGGGPLGAMFGADTGGGSMYGGGGGGGLFGDYGGGGGPSYGGGTAAGNPFGSFGTLGASNMVSSVNGPDVADTAGSTSGPAAGPASIGRSDAPTRSEAEVSSVSEADQAAPEAAPDEAAPEVASPSDFGTPSETSAPEVSAPEASTAPSRSQADPSPSLSDAAPSGWIGGEPDAAAPSQSAFGPQTVTHSEPTDYQGSPYADMGPQGDTWGSVFEGAAPTQAVEPGAEQYGTQAMDFAPQGELGSRSFFNAPFWNAEPAWAQNAPTVSEAMQPGGPLSALGRGYDFLSNLPGTLSNALNPSVPTMLQAPSTMDLQALGEQGKAGQPDVTDWGSVFEGAAPALDATDWGSVFAAPDQAPDYASVFEGTPSSPDWSSVFEGAPSNEPDWGSVFEGAAPTEPDWGSVFEGADPTVASPYDTTMESPPGEQPSTDNAATPGSDPALSGKAAADAAQEAGAPSQAGKAAEEAASQSALNGGTPAEQATAAMGAALEAGATQAQADAIAGAVYDAAAGQQQQQARPDEGQQLVSREAFESLLTNPGDLPSLNLPSVNLTPDPGIPWGSVFEGAAPTGQQPATPEVEQPGAPTGPQTTPQSAPPPPSLVDMAQPGATRSESFIPGGRTTDFNYLPSSTPPPAPPSQPATALPPGQPDGQPGQQPADQRNDDAADPHAPDQNAPSVQPGGRLGAPTTGTQNTPVISRNVIQEQQGSTRNRPVSEALHSILSRAAEQAGVTVHVGSGGQIATRSRADYRQQGGWTGSIRHNHGNAADVRLEVNGRFLNYNNPQDRVVMENFVREAARLGATGMGAGMAYMGPNTIHVGFGNPAFWRADNAGSRALQQAWNEGRQGPANRPPGDIPNVRTAQQRPAAPPGGWRGIGGDIGREARLAPQVEVAQPAITPQQPAALPPQQEAPAPRPQADIPIDIPVQTVPPALAARTSQAAMQFAKFLADNLAKTGKLPSNREEGQRALNALAQELARAGYPASVAQRTILETATQGSIKAGYGPDSAFNLLGSVTKAINEMAGTAMQGYHAGKTPEAQGPPAPADLAPGKRSEAPFGQQFAGLSQPLRPAEGGREGDVGAREVIGPWDINPLEQLSPEPGISPAVPRAPNMPLPPPTPGLFSPFRGNEASLQPEAPSSLLSFLSNLNPISTAEARGGGRSQAANLQAPRADPGTIQSRLSDARSNIIDDLQTNLGLRNTLDLIVTGEVGSQGKAAVLGFLETAMNKVAAEAAQQGRAPTGRDLLNYLNNRSYFPDTWGKIESGKIKGGALTDDLLGAIAAGSNITGLSTGNSSATSSGSRFGGNPTNATIGREHYGVENYGHHAAWYNAMGAPPPGRGIGSDYATAPWGDFPAVGAQPAQESPPRGLAKGGHVAEDEKVVVGEEGPEYFVPDRPGTIVPHMPQPGVGGGDRHWPKMPAVDYPGRYGDVEREIKRQTRAAQDFVPSLMNMIDSGQLRFNPAAWDRWLNDPKDVALGRSRIEDRRAYSYDYPY